MNCRETSAAYARQPAPGGGFSPPPGDESVLGGRVKGTVPGSRHAALLDLSIWGPARGPETGLPERPFFCRDLNFYGKCDIVGYYLQIFYTEVVR